MEITLVITILAAVTALIAAAGVFTSRSMLTRSRAQPHMRPGSKAR